MTPLLLLLSALPALAWAQSCTIGQGSVQSCASHIAIIVDSTSYMGSAQRTSQLAQYINTYLSQYDFSSGYTAVTQGFYGMSDPSVSWSPILLFFAQTDPSMICADYTDLIQAQVGNNMGTCTMSNALASLFNVTNGYDWNYDEIVWFTGTTDNNDVQLAGSLVQDFPAVNFTIININGADFSNWPSSQTRVLCPSQFPFASGYEAKINKQACRTASGDVYCGTSYTSQPPVQSTAMPTPTAAPTTQCPCKDSMIWNDIVIAYDGSNVLPEDKFQMMIVMLQTLIYKLPISQKIGQYSRVGLVSYDDTVNLVAKLTTFNSSIDALSSNWTRNAAKEHTNIKGAIDMARNMFEDSKQHRSNVRKVIILAASTYREGSYDFPNTTATTFKDNEGIIIVIGYGDLKGEASDVLKNLASPGYFIDATKNPNLVLGQATSNLCGANCFCPKPYQSVYSDATQQPTHGCYLLSDLTGVQFLASRFCMNQRNGVLAMPKDSAQKIFATSKVSLRTKVWVGLQNVGGRWQWSDGTPFTDSINGGVGSCATISRNSGFNTSFTPATCDGDTYDWACQTTPCSTGNYCTS